MSGPADNVAPMPVTPWHLIHSEVLIKKHTQLIARGRIFQDGRSLEGYVHIWVCLVHAGTDRQQELAREPGDLLYFIVCPRSVTEVVSTSSRQVHAGKV